MAGERILVVDDEKGVRKFLTRLFIKENYQVQMAENGAAALAILQQQSFDVCITDLRLPDMSGIEILRHIKQVHPTCEVIILTAYGELQTAIEVLRLGAYDYMQKPILDLTILLITVARALEHQAMSKHNARLIDDLAKANRELALRRRQQLNYINYIGKALSAALQYQDVAQLLTQATLELIGCDAAGVCLLKNSYNGASIAILGGRKPLAAATRRALLETMLLRLPEELRPAIDTIRIRELPALEPSSDQPEDDTQWQHCQGTLLSTRDAPLGVALIASHSKQTYTEEAMGFFDILVTQASVALENAYLFERANELATRNGLTGLYNHRHFFELLEAEMSRAERHNQQLAVIMVDVDRSSGGLKMVNDTYGHQAGDEMLRQIADFILHNVRRADVVARYGGDEFIILAPQTGADEAAVLGKRLCEGLATKEFQVGKGAVHITVSVGVAVYCPSSRSNSTAIVSLADQGLYQAKERGGGQVCIACTLQNAG
jgi:diguanylate cyclase (GGDEF)-like protein